MKLMSVVGARPQFIKASVISRLLRQIPHAEEVLVHTGQHYDHHMSQIFFDELELTPPALNLGIGSGPHGEQTGRMLEVLERAMTEMAPDGVLIYGDTNSTLAGSLAAAKLHIPVAHVEAGLRSHNRVMPEEINRLVVDQLSDLLFAPSSQAVANLLREGRPAQIIFEVGDVMYDVALRVARLVQERSHILERLGVQAGCYIIATLHRAENLGNPQRLSALVQGLGQASAQIPVLLPLHPGTKRHLEELNIKLAPGITSLEPLGYLDMTALIMNSRLVVTDSGGLQKEAFYHHVPCLTLRTETEWVELVALGWNTLAPLEDASSIAMAVAELVAAGSPPPTQAQPYGDGQAAQRIVDQLLAFFPVTGGAGLTL